MDVTARAQRDVAARHLDSERMPSFNALYFFSAKTQHQNLGDGIISRELLRLLRSHGQVQLLDGGMPPEFLALIEADRVTRHASTGSYVGAIVRSALRQRFQAGAPRVYYALNPGGFNGGVTWGDLPRQFALILTYVALWALGVRLIRLGQSVGPFLGARLPIERVKSRFIHAATARDPLSLRYAAESGLGPMRYFPDLALMLEPRATRTALPARPYVVASFRSSPKRAGYDDGIERLLRQALGAGGVGAGLDRLFASQVTFDRARSRQLAERLSDLPGETRIDESTGFDEVLALYRDAEAVFSNRLHVVLLAMRVGTPAYAIVDHGANAKVIGILEDLGFREMVIDLDAPQLPRTWPERQAYELRCKNVFAAKREQAVATLRQLLAE